MRRALSKAFSVRQARGGSILAWGRRYFPDYFKLPPGRHHLTLDSNMRRWSKERGVRAAIEGPRDSAKSTILTFLYPLWSVCHGLEDYILLLADTYGQAVKHLKCIQHELEFNEVLAADYPIACGRGSEWNNEGVLTRNGVRIEPLGAGQKIRGRRKLHVRPTLIIIDDPEGDEAAYSAPTRATTREWATKGVFKAGDAGRTNIIIGATVIHRECLVAHCGRLPGWRRLAFKSIESWPERMDLWGEWDELLRDNGLLPEDAEKNAAAFYRVNKDDMNAGARVLWPEQESLYELMFMRASEGHTSFESEKQNNPIDPSKCEWDPALFEGEEVWFDRWPAKAQCATMSLDPSKGRRDKAGDYQAIVQLLVGEDGNLYVDADISKRSIQNMVGRFIELSASFKPDVAVVEDAQFQELLIPEIQERSTRAKLLVPVEGISTGNVPKRVRIRRLSPYVSRRRIRYKRRSAGAVLLRRMMMDFPTADHDDGPDALEMAVRRAEQLLGQGQVEGQGVENPY